MLIDKDTAKEKHLLALEREYWDLQEQNTGTIVPIEPYQHGWIRYWVVRDTLPKEKFRPELEEVLLWVNTNAWWARCDFKHKVKKGVWEDIRPTMGHLTEYSFQNRLPEHLQKWFIRRDEWEWKTPVVRYYVRHPNLFVLKVEPNIITHQHIPDAAIESRMKEIREVLWTNPENSGLIWGNCRDYDYTERLHKFRRRDFRDE